MVRDTGGHFAEGPDIEGADPEGVDTPEPLPTTRHGMLRYRILPRSVIGISMLLVAFAVGAGFSGVVLYSYYQYKQDQANSKVNAIVNGYKTQFAKAEANLNNVVTNAKAQINSQLKGAEALAGGPEQAASLVTKLAPSIFFVHTLTPTGAPSVGTAFVVSSGNGQTLLLTSYTAIEAATKKPAPQVFVSKGDSGTKMSVTVHSWDATHDLALLILDRTGYTPIAVAPATPAIEPGQPLYAVSGASSAGAAVTSGAVIDVFSGGLASDAAIGPAFQGGPIVNASGQVIAVASRAYSPLGFSPSAIYYAPLINTACAKVLSCPGGSVR